MEHILAKNRGSVEFNSEKCKGCGLCIEICAGKVLGLSGRKNAAGYRTAEVLNADKCSGCALCFYTCPEPGVIRVFRLDKE